MALRTLATANTRGIIDTAERMAETMRAELGGVDVQHAITRVGWEKRVVDTSGVVIGVVAVRIGDPDTVIESGAVATGAAGRAWRALLRAMH
jgi:hypothetical protein